MVNNNNQLKEGNGLSRRRFIQNCAIGVVALKSGVLTKSLTMHESANTRGAANLKFLLDQNWLFGGKFIPQALQPGFDDSGFKTVTIPHAVVDLSWEDWDYKSWQDVWIYRKHFILPSELKGMRLFLKFDGAMVNTSPAVNGHDLPVHAGGYLPFQYEITDLVRDGQNVLAVKVDSRWNNVPPDGSQKGTSSVDYLEVGGIHRPVYLQAVPKIFISDVFAKPVNVLSNNRQLQLTCTVDAAILAGKTVSLKAVLKDDDRVIGQADKRFSFTSTGAINVNFSMANIPGITLWDVDHPKLYQVVTTLLIDGKQVHNHSQRIGFREARFELNGFFLNGRRLQLFGLNRHEIYPYVGFAMPERVMHRDAEILKHDFNCNVVRCSHYPQSDAFMDACDEFGLMVWEEVPGWQYIGDEQWQKVLLDNTKDMVIRDRSRPSVIIWGSRVNESANDVDLYKATSAITKALDDSRPTSGTMTPGTRKNWKQDWHEDVFAYDDYHAEDDGSVGILPPVNGYPYMLAEAVGQFNYPKQKGFNAFYRRGGEVSVQQQQAINHAQAHSRTAANPRNCGVIAWCAFEYASLLNNYRNVKNPGVADVFRIPKLGASFYQAQSDPKVKAIIQPNFYWDFGPATPNGPGKQVAIFSNCDKLRLLIDGKPYVTIKSDIKNYPNLKHVPFFADLEFMGKKPVELTIEGYLHETKVCSNSYSADASRDQFILIADDKEINGDGVDATRLVFRVTDGYGAPRLFASGTINFTINGPGIIVGDNPFNLMDAGGAAAVWLKTTPNASGRVMVTAVHSLLGAKSIHVNINALNKNIQRL